MIGMSAVIFIPDDTAKTGYPQPLMLQSVMGAPLLAWLANALFDSGVGRFFLVCHDRYVEAARACLPAEAEVMTTMDSDPADLLHVFLSTAEDAEHTITVVTGPAVYLPQLAPQAAGRFPRVYGVSREELMQALDEHFSFARFLLDSGSPMNEEQAMYSVASPAELPEIAGLLQRNRLLALARTGVEIYDASSCYVEPSVRVAPGARLLPGHDAARQNRHRRGGRHRPVERHRRLRHRRARRGERLAGARLPRGAGRRRRSLCQRARRL